MLLSALELEIGLLKGSMFGVWAWEGLGVEVLLLGLWIGQVGSRLCELSRLV